jgi:hypothetical protein
MLKVKTINKDNKEEAIIKEESIIKNNIKEALE